MIFPWFNSICICSLLIASFLLSESITWLVTGFPHPVDHTGSPQDNQTLTSNSIISTCTFQNFFSYVNPFSTKSIKSTLTSPRTHTNSTYWQWLTMIWGPPLWSALGQTQQEQCWCWELGHCLPLVDCSVKPAANTDTHPHVSQADLYKHSLIFYHSHPSHIQPRMKTKLGPFSG